MILSLNNMALWKINLQMKSLKFTLLQKCKSIIQFGYICLKFQGVEKEVMKNV